MKKVLVFDLDGVLFNSVDLMNDFTLGEFKNITLDDARALHRTNIHEALKLVQWERVDETEEETLERSRVYRENKKLVPLYNGIKDLISELSKEFILVVNSSATEENCVPLLERENILDYFDLVATKELHTSKVEKFVLIAERYEQPIADMLFVTDTIGDLKESAIVALPTIAVTWGIHTHDEFEGVSYGNLIAIVDTLEELKAAIYSQ